MNWFKNLFKKKQKVVDTNGRTLNVGDYKLKLTIKAMCLFEQLTGKSFLALDDTDLVDMLYAMFVTSNNLRMSKDAFVVLMEDERVAKWMIDEYTRQSKFDSQLRFFNRVKEVGASPDEIEKERHDNPVTITSIAGSFIANGIDPHYVMYDMELWEIDMYEDAIVNETRTRLDEQRLFTWLSMMPHLDKKAAAKLKHPSDLLPFPWDEDIKERKQKELDKNAGAAMAFFAKQNEKDGK